MMINFNTKKWQILLAGMMSFGAFPAMAQMSHTFVRAVNTGNDDAEEATSGTLGAMDLTSSDLELMTDGSKTQVIGLRFAGITIPQGAVINRAFVQFTTKGDKNAISGTINISAQAHDNAPSFTSTGFNISSRTDVGVSVFWEGSTHTSWGLTGGGSTTENQRTPDVKSVLQPVINRAGWAPGSSVVLILKGDGVRNACSYNNGAATAPKLIIEYTSAAIPPMLTGTLPISKLSEWKYLDNGTDQGTAWAAAGFNDDNWSYGPAKLGYSRNAVTTLSFGPDNNNKYITSYFRKHVNIASIAALQDSLDLNMLRDDGAIVYVNGVEVVRSNMPAGAINYLTLAPTNITAPNETEYNVFRIPKTAFTDGNNTIAVEIHQQSGTSSDIAFDLELKEYVPPVMVTTNFPVATNSDWKYLDNGTDLGTTWTTAAYNDASWAFGPGQLGYNNSPATVVNYGPDQNNKYITTYFRKKINVANAATLTDSIQLNLLRDDGAVIYINGTEVVRSNMPEGSINYRTLAPENIDGAAELVWHTYFFPKSVFVTGVNTIAVEVHQRDVQSSDLGFDLSMNEYVAPPVAQNCNPLPATHISNFVSVLPSAQPDSMRIPATHTFQMLVQSGDAYTNPADGTTKGLFDFTGYVPIAGSSTNGYLSINHEQGSWPTAGVSMLNLNYNQTSKLWSVTNNAPVDFGPVQGTGRNCSGTVTPWNTIITCEETLPTSDANGDGYQDIGWAVEIDPATRTVIDNNGDNTPDKLWKLGRMSHENVVVDADMKTVYEGNDEAPGFIFKLVADVATKLNSGNLYVLKLNGAIGTSTTGTWLQVPNSTPAECNSVRNYAASVGATDFNQIEDVEISPLDKMVYFTSKSSSRVYRFLDNKTVGSTTDVVNCTIFVGNESTQYPITHAGGTVNEQWRGGNDNLTFDNEGNLYVIQDGGRNHIWMVKPCHTQADPKVELFMVTPAGCEPTGMTFSPDNRFMFVSMQHPNSTNATGMIDATGNAEVFNRESAIVVARKEFLGNNAVPLPISFISFDAQKTAENKVALNWKYVTDETIARFEIQRLNAGDKFETIEKLEQKGTNGLAQFNYIDANPYGGKNFYRIKAIQADGKEVFTNTKMIDIAITGQLSIVKSYPNPATNVFNVTLISPAAKQSLVKVYNTTGVLVQEQKAALNQGSNNVQLNIEALPAGVYNVVIIAGTETIKTRVVKN